MKKGLISLLLLLVTVLFAVSAVADEGMKIISFSDAGLDKDTDGVTFVNSTLTIRNPGEYMLSGELTDGQLCVDCSEEGKVTLYLNGVTVRTSSITALMIGECKPKLVLSLVDQTDNVFSNGSLPGPDEDEEPNGAIFSRSDLVIEGSGSLQVNALSGDGIVSKDELEIHGGKIRIDAKRHGIKGKDCVEIYSGEITITACRDGIKSTNKKDSARGYIAIRGGVISIQSGDEPLQFVTDCTIENAKITLSMKE